MNAAGTMAPKRTSVSKRLRLIQAVILILLVVSAIWTVVGFAMVFTSSTLVSPLEVSLNTDTLTNEFPEGASIAEADAWVNLEAGLGYRFLWWIVTDAFAILAIPFLEILRRTLADRAEPFTKANLSRLRWLMWLAVSFAVLDILRPLISMFIQNNFDLDGSAVLWDPSSLIEAAVLAGLLEIWRHGIALRTDSTLTI